MTTNEKEMSRLYQGITPTQHYGRTTKRVYLRVLQTILTNHDPFSLYEPFKPNLLAKNITIEVLNTLERNKFRTEEYLDVLCSFLTRKNLENTSIHSASYPKTLVEYTDITVSSMLSIQEKITFNGDVWGYGEIPTKKPPVTSPKVSNFNRGSGR